ncbi:hypothetical protein DWQ65_02360 [Treponema phagedenis]|nr:hypothetical protein C5O78_06130 [Treponema phagedenis]QSH98936.1 hypothetical protein DWQ65_02360 [Treponema phagedenis]
MVFLTGLKEVPTDEWTLKILYEFSLEYDRDEFRMLRQMEKMEEQKVAAPKKAVMKNLGYSEMDLLKE